MLSVNVKQETVLEEVLV